ncbi:ATP-binding protein [Gorillibacterium sp. CAU 1737]|uniref:sensor histidine kinase n=1 Tax=Gorillibacterium sp. CAU 1737 TaxID=3140362 RepID=UPI0032608308
MTFTRKTVLLMTGITAIILLVSHLFVFVTYSRWTEANRVRVLDAQLAELEQRITDVTFLPKLLRYGSLTQLFKPDLTSLESNLREGQLLRLIDKSGKVLAYTGDEEQATAQETSSTSSEKDTESGRTILGNDEFVYAQKEINLVTLGKVRLQLLETVTVQDALVDQIGKLLRVSAVLGVGLAAAGGYVAARRTLQPVKSMTERVRGMDGARLEDRLVLPAANDEIRELALTFNRLLDRIDSGLELQRQFVADASHELKTPLAAIEGHSQLLRRWGKEKPEVLDESLGYILSETERMKRLTQQLLLLAELEERGAGSASALNTDAAGILQELAKEGARLYPELAVSTSGTDLPLPVTVPAFELEHAMRNVLFNALAYTPAGGTVSVELVQRGDEVCTLIRDTGIGIPAEDLPHVFERFYRSDKSRSRERGGTGLGLAIVKRIADTYRGTVWIESTPGIGTRVTLTFPAAKEGGIERRKEAERAIG